MAIQNIGQAFRSLQPGSELAQKAEQTEFFQRAKEKARRVHVGEQEYYLLEGDLLLDEVQLAEYAVARENPPAEESMAETDVGGQRAKLLGITRNGKMVRWKPGMILSYFVAKETFPSEQQYQTAREAVRAATEDWMKVCGVQFEYRQQLDADPSARTQGAALFPIIHFDSGGEFIAAAFFPDDPPDRRVVLIDPSFFDPGGFDKTGVLRHELGHVLGCRHEHIRSEAPPGCRDEPLFGTIDLTKYDPRSVMHYFCGGAGTRELAITELDQRGTQRLYGLPLNLYHFVG